jgi:glutamine cyclotransferase
VLAAVGVVWAVAAAAQATPPPGSSVARPSAAPDASAPSWALPSASPAEPVLLRWEVVARYPHDASAWTQGLVFDRSGRLFESTGLIGRSQLRELDPATGAVLRSVMTPDGAYGEGLALVGDQLLVQLTWQDGRAYRYEADTLRLVDTLPYAGEGWGLCWDGSRLVMSDGSDTLTFRDDATFAVEGTIRVTLDGVPVTRLNELECVDGEVWANVWETHAIVRIDPATGRVTGVLDLTGLLVPDPAGADPGAVLNGIARLPAGDTWLLTGKLWPEAIEVRILDPGA